MYSFNGHLCGDALTGAVFQQVVHHVQVILLRRHVQWREAILEINTAQKKRKKKKGYICDMKSKCVVLKLYVSIMKRRHGISSLSCALSIHTLSPLDIAYT